MNLLAPMLARIAKRKLRNPRRRLLRNDLQRLHHARNNLVLQPGVQILGILAHDHQIDVRIARLQPRQILHRPEVRKQLELLPQRHVDRREPAAHRSRHRPLQRHLVLFNRPVQRLRNVLAKPLERLRPRRKLVPVERHARRLARGLHNPHHRRRNLRPNPIPGDQRNRMLSCSPSFSPLRYTSLYAIRVCLQLTT